MPKKLTTEEFIAKAKLIHNDKYDYSDVIYTTAREIVVIRCKMHDNKFLQTPDNHLHGKGCYECGLKKQVNDRTLSIEEFINRANTIHGNKYDYSEINYKNNRTNISIICKKHGMFLQSPDNHLNGNGCPKCHHRISKCENEFLDYVKVDIKNRQKYIKPYKVDGIDRNVIYEFLGDYFHGNPDLFDACDYNKTCQATFGLLYHKTLNKLQFLNKKGYIVKFIWESDWNKFKQKMDDTPKILEYK